jgi:hypothetical protein
MRLYFTSSSRSIGAPLRSIIGIQEDGINISCISFPKKIVIRLVRKLAADRAPGRSTMALNNPSLNTETRLFSFYIHILFL